MWQTILGGLGAVLSFFYDVIPNYGVAIILLTLAVRVLLLPLTLKQTRSMHAMQAIQPQVKALQQKHKGNRQKLNEELMKLYKEHQVNPLGGCLPLILQLPVFIALYSVLRATIPVYADVGEPVVFSEVSSQSGELVCAPNQMARVDGPEPTAVVCTDDSGNEETFPVRAWLSKSLDEIAPPAYLFRCVPPNAEARGADARRFSCVSPGGTGNIPSDSALFRTTVEEGAGFLGMDLGCSASQAPSEQGIRLCAHAGTKAGGPALVGYFGLVALMVLTTFYQQKQMTSVSGQQQGQAQMMMKIMPVFLGVISWSIPAGVLVYWVTTNLWQVGQQHVMLKARAQSQVEGSSPGRPAPVPPKSSAKSSGKNEGGSTRPAGVPPKSSGGKNAGSRKKRRKR